MDEAQIDEVLGQLNDAMAARVLIEYTGPVFIDTGAYIPSLQMADGPDPYADLVESVREKVTAPSGNADWRGILRIRVEVLYPRTKWGWGQAIPSTASV